MLNKPNNPIILKQKNAKKTRNIICLVPAKKRAPDLPRTTKSKGTSEVFL